MPAELRPALRAGYERMVAWADVLDRINLFPVPDGDTGRNLVISLAPLRAIDLRDEELQRRLLMSARGNSGNIATEFVRGLLQPGHALHERLARGAALAHKAVSVPKPGTMLTILQALARETSGGLDATGLEPVLRALEQAVRGTTEQQEVLRKAGVVDSGALGTMLLLDGMLRAFFGAGPDPDLADRFRSLVRFERGVAIEQPETGCCIDVVVRMRNASTTEAELDPIGSEVVTLRQGDLWKIHLHAADPARARSMLEQLGEVVRWSWDDLHEQTTHVAPLGPCDGVHVITDGAGSVTRRDAGELGVTLLDSHIAIGDVSLPESRISPEDLYGAMKRGVRVATSQASNFERHQHYERIAGHYQSVLYLCVGSAFTGNFEAVSAWRSAHALGDRIRPVDSGAASGRLAVVVWDVARRARQGMTAGDLEAHARAAFTRAEEYIFLERLDYLARGGRISKAGAFFGDAIGIAPVVTPRPDGVHKVGLFRKLQDRVSFALERLQRSLAPASGKGFVLLEYTDNEPWVQQELLPRVHERCPSAELVVRPFSLTTGAHTGPGTWAVAVLPQVP